MSWNDILVFADGSANGVARAQMAARLALDFEARLEMCVVTILPPRAYGEGAAAVADMLEEGYRLARDDAGRAVDAIRAALPELSERLSVQAPEIEMADAPRLAGALARSADLVVVGQPIEADVSRLDEALLEGALMRSGRPCLVLPRWPQPRSLGRRALVAWKGAREAARAVHDALPLLQRAHAVQIYMAGAGDELDGEGPLGLARVASHLARRGVKVESEPKIGRRTHDVGEQILAQAADFGADLIVMGGYGHARVSEFVFGGATRTVLRASALPVFMAH